MSKSDIVGSLTSAASCESTLSDALPNDIDTLKGLVRVERARNADLTKRVATSVPMILAYQQYIPCPPAQKQELWQAACSADGVTAASWKKIWMDNIKYNVAENHADEHMVDKHYGKYAFRPAIIAGSGPSLKKNVDILAKETPSDIPIVSCLHNFGFFVDKGVPCDYYMTLDAGEVTIPEMTEGGSDKDKTKYLKASEKKTLIAGLVTPPELLKQWKGEILYFNATIPDMEFMTELPKVTKNKWVYSVGGNTLGACFYHASYIFGCNPIAFVGADFSFDYMHKFHSWDSAYDAQFQGLVPATDCFGNRVYTWNSYRNFAAWFLFQAMGGQGNHNLQMINCTEGGILGAFPDGNAMQIKQLRLIDFLDGYTRWQRLKEGIEKTAPDHYSVMC